MHYYNFHIKDYHAATSHLSIEEDCCYRRLLDYYYEQESGIHSDDVEYVARRIRIHPETVQQILDEFFTLLDGVYFSRRADTEIEAYHKKSEGGKKGAASRWAEGKSKDSHGIAIANPLPTQSVPNAKPMLTINHKPLTNNQEESISPDGELKKEIFDLSNSLGINPSMVGKAIRDVGEYDTFSTLEWAATTDNPKTAFAGGIKTKAKNAELNKPEVYDPAEIVTLPDGRQMNRASLELIKRFQ